MKCLLSFYLQKYAMYTTEQRSICYTVQHQLDAKSSKAAEEQRFRNNENSEWGPGAAQAMCEETRDFPLPIPGSKTWTLGDLYDRTPQERISKVMLEEKVFKTWYSGRTVLMGDGKQIVYSGEIRMQFNMLCNRAILMQYLYSAFVLRLACHKLHPSGGHGKDAFVLPVDNT